MRTTPTSAAPDAFGNQGARSSFALVLRGNLNRAKQCQPFLGTITRPSMRKPKQAGEPALTVLGIGSRQISSPFTSSRRSRATDIEAKVGAGPKESSREWLSGGIPDFDYPLR